jgi:succinate dehydrogenase / fumarate reductase, cytochrome b subunit
MADAISRTSNDARPLSPHLGIYRQQINMVMSIVHRITGAALYFGTLLLAWWLIAIAQGPDALATVNMILGHPLGKLVLVGYTWALVHHMLGGIRHLIWDTGRGYNLGTVNLMGWLTILGSLAVTAALWGYALHLQGMF